MKKTLLVILVVTLLSGSMLPVFAYQPEDTQTEFEPLNNNRYRRVIERSYRDLGSRTITAQDIADRDKVVYAITEVLSRAGAGGAINALAITIGDALYGRRETGTLRVTVEIENWYQEHRLTGKRYFEATYHTYSAVIGGIDYGRRLRIK